ncbi:hypothetical protein F0P93_25575 [Larkinella humicola]|uniref:Uncharacterized protein n=2 Tax=Larkinella humicola TaxID=2607654 RepID=A0A5N1J732_9BACT|nr:hypothetical protein F0P93_25575 [Larkinella humicola]
MTVDNQTIIRWDNTPHFPEFETHPFHRHLGSDEAPEAFPAIAFADVLQFIMASIDASPQ